MMEKETSLNPQQSLNLIAEVISQTRQNLKQHGFIFLLWGWLLAIASILRFLLQTQTDFKFYFAPFPVLAALGIITTVSYYSRSYRQTNETHLNYFIKSMWIVLAAGFIITVFVSVYQKVEPFTYTLIIAGVGTLVTGMVMKFRPLLLGGIFFLASAVSSVFLPDVYKVLLHGVAIIIGYIIPGYLLKNTEE
jgi:predicted neutral ceramidase superfamily lipid hydrolase